MTTETTTKKSPAKKLRWLYKKHKKLIRSYKETSNFKEPTLQLKRQSGKVEFFENATGTQFYYQHSDGSERFIILQPEKRLTFEYGNKTFSGYICDEDNPLPLPENPLVTTETFGLAIEKTLNDIKKWKAEETRAKAAYIKQIGITIAIVIGLIILYKMVIQPNTNTTTIIKDASLGLILPIWRNKKRK